MKKRVLLAIMGIAVMMTGCGLLQSKEPKMIRLLGSSAQMVTGTMPSPWLHTSITNYCYRNLFISSATTDETIPDLIDTYTISEDGRTYEMTLKPNLVWSDGEAITLNDVVFSLEAVMRTEQVNTLFQYAFPNIVGATAYANGETDAIEGLSISGDVLTMQLEKPMHTLVPILAQFAILPEHALKDADVAKIHEDVYWQDPIVSGIYKFGDKVQGEYITYVPNENYAEKKPEIDILMLRADYTEEDLDYTSVSNVSSILSYRTIPAMKEYDVETVFYRYLLFNLNQNGAEETIIDDVNVRTAIIQSVDFETILSDVYYGATSTEDVEYKTYDVERAKRLLAEAEYEFTRPLVLLTPFVDADTAALVQMMAEYIEVIGFDVEVVIGGNLYTDIYDIAINDLSAVGDFQWYTEYSDTHTFRDSVLGDCSDFDPLLDALEAAKTDAEYQAALGDLKLKSVEKVYKFPFLTMNHKAYVNRNRVVLPSDLVFGNSRYKFDMDLSNWDVKE